MLAEIRGNCTRPNTSNNGHLLASAHPSSTYLQQSTNQSLNSESPCQSFIDNNAKAKDHNSILSVQAHM